MHTQHPNVGPPGTAVFGFALAVLATLLTATDTLAFIDPVLVRAAARSAWDADGAMLLYRLSQLIVIVALYGLYRFVIWAALSAVLMVGATRFATYLVGA